MNLKPWILYRMKHVWIQLIVKESQSNGIWFLYRNLHWNKKQKPTHNSSWVGLFWMIMLLFCRWLARTTKPLEIWYGTWYTVRITSPTLIKPGKWIHWVGRHTHTFSYSSLAGHSSARLCYNSFNCLLNDIGNIC